MDIVVSKKLESLPPYLFAEIDAAKRKAKAEGRNIIDLGVGDPDIPTRHLSLKNFMRPRATPGIIAMRWTRGCPN
jgi:LL-diaminopimelate aminotransferase